MGVVRKGVWVFHWPTRVGRCLPGFYRVWRRVSQAAGAVSPQPSTGRFEMRSEDLYRVVYRVSQWMAVWTFGDRSADATSANSFDCFFTESCFYSSLGLEETR